MLIPMAVPRGQVRSWFQQRGITPRGFTVGRIAKLPQEKQTALFNLLQSVTQIMGKGSVKEIKTPTLHVLNTVNIDRFDAGYVIAHCLTGGLLDLRRIAHYSLTAEEYKKMELLNTRSVTVHNANMEAILARIRETSNVEIKPGRFLEDSDIIQIGKFTIERIDRPSEDERFQMKLGTVIKQLREAILEIYRPEEKGVSDDELIKRLALEDHELIKRIYNVGQLQVVREGNRIVGLSSSKLIKVDDEYALYIPITMMNPKVQGRRLHVRMVYEAAVQFAREVIWSKGLIRGLWKMFSKGLPIIVRTQSKLVTMDIIKRTSKWFVPVAGAIPDERTEKIIRRTAYHLDSEIGSDFLFRNVYVGRISSLRDLRMNLRDPALNALFAKLGERDAIPVVGYLNFIAFQFAGWEMKRVAAKEEERVKSVNLQV